MKPTLPPGTSSASSSMMAFEVRSPSGTVVSWADTFEEARAKAKQYLGSDEVVWVEASKRPCAQVFAPAPSHKLLGSIVGSKL